MHCVMDASFIKLLYGFTRTAMTDSSGILRTEYIVYLMLVQKAWISVWVARLISVITKRPFLLVILYNEGTYFRQIVGGERVDGKMRGTSL